MLLVMRTGSIDLFHRPGLICSLMDCGFFIVDSVHRLLLLLKMRMLLVDWILVFPSGLPSGRCMTPWI